MVDQPAEREEIGGKSERKRIPLGDVATANLSKPSETLSESGPIPGQGQGQEHRRNECVKGARVQLREDRRDKPER